MLVKTSVLAAILSLGLAGSAAAADYCFCDGLLINYVGSSNGYDPVTLQSPATASPLSCGLACDAELNFDCNTALFTPGSNICTLYNLSYLRTDNTLDVGDQQSLASGTCASYGIDVTVRTACQDFETPTPVTPTQLTRRRQLGNERRKRDAAAAGVY